MATRIMSPFVDSCYDTLTDDVHQENVNLETQNICIPFPHYTHVSTSKKVNRLPTLLHDMSVKW